MSKRLQAIASAPTNTPGSNGNNDVPTHHPDAKKAQ
jgi:hypothetical protein